MFQFEVKCIYLIKNMFLPHITTAAISDNQTMQQWCGEFSV